MLFRSRHLGDGVLANPGDGDIVLAPGVGDAEGDASGHLVRRRAPERVEVAEELYRRTDANVGLVEVGEDGEDEDGVGMKME